MVLLSAVVCAGILIGVVVDMWEKRIILSVKSSQEMRDFADACTNTFGWCPNVCPALLAKVDSLRFFGAPGTITCESVCGKSECVTTTTCVAQCEHVLASFNLVAKLLLALLPSRTFMVYIFSAAIFIAICASVEFVLSTEDSTPRAAEGTSCMDSEPVVTAAVDAKIELPTKALCV